MKTKITQNLIFCCFIQIAFLSSCTTLQNNAKYELADGKYKRKMDGKKLDCYVENTTDSIFIYQLPSRAMSNLPQELKSYSASKQYLIKSSLDIDVLTVLFKVRPDIRSLPTQLNADFNGNIYVGHRTDVYQINYKKNPLDVYKRQINHFGFSAGVFVGVGNTALNSSTTNNAIGTDYEGIVLQKGVAGIIAVNKLTIGIGLGFDNLLDKNKTNWLYENKPWFGLMLGLNLN